MGVPRGVFIGRYQAGMHRQLVISAADGGMNMLRMWGGGIYPVDEFLDACDDVGVLVFTDMMYIMTHHSAVMPLSCRCHALHHGVTLGATATRCTDASPWTALNRVFVLGTARTASCPARPQRRTRTPSCATR